MGQRLVNLMQNQVIEFIVLRQKFLGIYFKSVRDWLEALFSVIRFDRISRHPRNPLCLSVCVCMFDSNLRFNTLSPHILQFRLTQVYSGKFR